MIAESSSNAVDLELSYQGPGFATEIWGVLQANFMLAIRGESLREMAVNVGPPVAAFLRRHYEPVARVHGVDVYRLRRSRR